MKKVALLVYMALFLFFAGEGHALDLQGTIEAQQKAVAQGMTSRQLTKEEANVLQDNLNRIKMRASRTKTGGKLSKAEEEDLNKLLEQNARMIKDKKASPVRPLSVYHLEERAERQQKRIDQGIASRQLTKEEAEILQGNLSAIKTHLAKMRAEGKIIAEEEQKLHDMLLENSKMIRDKKTNPIRRTN